MPGRLTFAVLVPLLSVLLAAGQDTHSSHVQAIPAELLDQLQRFFRLRKP